MTVQGGIHLAAAVLAVGLGALVLVRRKGGAWHVGAGRGYLALMLVANLAGLTVFQDSPGFGPFHVLAVVSLMTLAAAFLTIRRRPRRVRDIVVHGIMMGWSYAGLAAAGIGQGAAALALPVWPAIAVTLALGAVVIHRGWIAEAARRIG